MFPSKKVLCIILLFLQACTNGNFFQTNSANSKNLIVPATTLLNPAIGFGSLVIGTSTVQKVYSAADLAYIAGNGESMAEGALSYSTNKNCRIVNILENQNICF